MKKNDRVVKAIIILVVVWLLSGIATFSYWTAEEVSFTVKKMERVYKGGDSRYLIFTEDEVLENSDIFWRFKFNSSDLYGKLEEGETYDALVYGWRIPFLSFYRNIIKVEDA